VHACNYLRFDSICGQPLKTVQVHCSWFETCMVLSLYMRVTTFALIVLYLSKQPRCLLESWHGCIASTGSTMLCDYIIIYIFNLHSVGIVVDVLLSL
jgi:hypothetical protein